VIRKEYTAGDRYELRKQVKGNAKRYGGGTIFEVMEFVARCETVIFKIVSPEELAGTEIPLNHKIVVGNLRKQVNTNSKKDVVFTISDDSRLARLLIGVDERTDAILKTLQSIDGSISQLQSIATEIRIHARDTAFDMQVGPVYERMLTALVASVPPDQYAKIKEIFLGPGDSKTGGAA
jgi:hypothetical protein